MYSFMYIFSFLLNTANNLSHYEYLKLRGEKSPHCPVEIQSRKTLQTQVCLLQSHLVLHTHPSLMLAKLKYVLLTLHCRASFNTWLIVSDLLSNFSTSTNTHFYYRKQIGYIPSSATCRNTTISLILFQ